MVFLCLLAAFIVPLFFYFPESKGLSLEEIARLFNEEITDVKLAGPETSDEKLAITKEKEHDAATSHHQSEDTPRN